MILQMVYIKKEFRGSENQLLNNANRINFTVFLISLLYLGSVAIFCFPILVAYLKLDFLFSDHPEVMIGKFTLPLLNAALFPTILILRNAALFPTILILRKPDLREVYWNYILTWCYLPLTVFRKVRYQVQRRRGYVLCEH
jgi:hypothetical protein